MTRTLQEQLLMRKKMIRTVTNPMKSRMQVLLLTKSQRKERVPEPEKERAPEPEKARAPEPEKERAPEPEKERAPEPERARAPEPEKERVPDLKKAPEKLERWTAAAQVTPEADQAEMPAVPEADPVKTAAWVCSIRQKAISYFRDNPLMFPKECKSLRKG